MGQSSPKEAWLLVYSCMRSYFKQLQKIRAPPITSSEDSTAQAGAYIWAMSQTHRVSQEFMSCQWRSHSSIARIITYYVFKFMVPLSLHNMLKE